MRLSPDEAVWLGQFYRVNVTPLFFVETLADLEKEVERGRTPEQVIGRIAEKTSVMAAQRRDNNGSPSSETTTSHPRPSVLTKRTRFGASALLVDALLWTLRYELRLVRGQADILCAAWVRWWQRTDALPALPRIALAGAA